ncbi:acyl carrier protein [Paenibacillus massiliensis]|uniref:acyl carrier protein n=1 Tax=Paenibacillus massiliensis TaxID=225917 RepID=UPI0004027B5B|nr:acyl carrier protein [Paenibacillus massiliensis]
MELSKENIKQLISNVIEVNGEEGVDTPLVIGEDVPLDTLGLDSMSFIRLILAIEQAFGIEFADEALMMENFETVNKILEHVAKVTMVQPSP